MPINSRNIKDAQFIAPVTPPAASGTANSTAFDLGGGTGRTFLHDQIEAEIALVAASTSVLPDTRTYTVTVQDSADNSTFAALDPSIATVQTGAGGAGAAAKTVAFRLPPGIRRYVRVSVTASASTGTPVASAVTFSLKF